jgi:hypothetical protein
LGRLPNGEAVPWNSLPVPDLDAALLALRRQFIGEQISTSVVCSDRAAGCRTRIDIAFRIGDYLEHHAPARLPRGVSPAAEPGWFQLDGAGVTGRLVTCADQVAVAGRPDAERALRGLCIRPAGVPARLRHRLEAAMAKIAPSLFDELEGRCPECETAVRIDFDPMTYVLAELRERARFVYEEVHLIAARYQWSEREILTLPRTRRERYAEFAHEAGVGR